MLPRFTTAAQAEPVLTQYQAGPRSPAFQREIIPAVGTTPWRGLVTRYVRALTLSHLSVCVVVGWGGGRHAQGPASGELLRHAAWTPVFLVGICLRQSANL